MNHRMSRRTRLLAGTITPLVALAGFGLALAVAAPSAQAATTLAGAAAGSGRYFGVAYATAHASDTTYAGIAGSQFNMVTPENEMKWDTVEASQGSFNYSPGDAVVTFATAHSEKVRGHNLVWHSQLPSWVSSLPTSSVQAAMENHITNEVTHFNGKIYAWDVVNEPFDDSGNYRTDAFYNAMGTNYIADALKTAHAADPSAKLYLNDYNIEGAGTKADAMYTLASSLKSAGVPLDGIGFETHLATQYGFPTNMQANMQRFADLGLDVAITELDVRMVLPETAALDATQQTYYDNVVKACVAISRCVGITTWGVSDNYSWVPSTFSGQGAPLLWDTNEQVKTTLYNSVISSLGGTVTTSSPTASASPTTSSPSPSPTTASPTPTSGSGSGCTATYAIVSQWGGGFQANVTVTNGSSARSSWTVGWTFPNGQTITQIWSATETQSGSAVTAKNMSYNGSLSAGTSTTFGFLGSWTGTNNAPSSVSCS
jgi:endo-1,4-beta-xylanase